MKKWMFAVIAALMAVQFSSAVTNPRVSGEAKAKVHRKARTGKITTNKDLVRQTKILQQVSKDTEVKSGKYVPPQSKQDVHPSTQF